MALRGAALGERLSAEATCPVCLELLSGPVLTPCGHTFCRGCLPGRGGSPPGGCPLCRSALPRDPLPPNRALAAVAELAAEEERRPRCPRHGEALRLFCRSCRRPLCPLCPGDDPHRHHRVRPAGEAARELRETLESNLVSLQKQKEEFEAEGETESDGLAGQVASEQQRLRDAFEELQRVLREQEDLLLAQFDRAQGQLAEERRRYVSSVSERKSLLETLVAEIEKKRDQPEVEFLMDIDKTLSSCEAAKSPIPEPVSLELQRTVKNLSEMSQVVVSAVAEFRVKLLSEVDRERVTVTLDPETASPYLTLSQDLKTLRMADGQQNLPDTPARFTGSPSVLASRGFTAGRHYWELEVGDGDSWAAGVAAESVWRKESLSVAMGKIWALRLDWNGQYTALHGVPAPLALEEKPRRIRVHLDYEAGRVTFYNAENMVQILQFEDAFTEKVFPYFWLWSQETCIQLCA